MVLQQLFTVHPPDKGPFDASLVVASEPKRIIVRGRPVDGWIVTITSDEDLVRMAYESVDDGE
jgi:hypothetical protein